MGKNVISHVVMSRLEFGSPQRIHIPWPQELGTYGSRTSTDADMDAWVANNIETPRNMVIVGICAGRAYRSSRTPGGNELVPCVVVTVGSISGYAPTYRNTWADGEGVLG